MPTYEYECGACKGVVEIFQSITEPPKKKCPSCGKQRLKRLIGGGSGFIFKGSGFYITDYRSESYKSKAKAESEGAAAGKESSGKESSGKESSGKESSGKESSKKEPAPSSSGAGGGSSSSEGGSSKPKSSATS